MSQARSFLGVKAGRTSDHFNVVSSSATFHNRVMFICLVWELVNVVSLYQRFQDFLWAFLILYLKHLVLLSKVSESFLSKRVYYKNE